MIARVPPYELEVQDVEYLRHGGKPLLARLFKPRGEGPFPLIVELHGGAILARNADGGGAEFRVLLPGD